MAAGEYGMNAAANNADLMNPMALALQRSFGGGMPNGGARMWDPTTGTWVVNPAALSGGDGSVPSGPTIYPGGNPNFGATQNGGADGGVTIPGQFNIYDPNASPPGGAEGGWSWNGTQWVSAPGFMQPGFTHPPGGLGAGDPNAPTGSPITTGMGFPNGEPRFADPSQPPIPNAPMDTSQPPPWMQTLLQQVQAAQLAQQPQPSVPTQPIDPNGPTLPAINGPVQGLPPTAAVGAPPTPDAYMQAITASMQPYFDESQKQLAAQLASQGILTSGAGNKQFQDLTARNNATVAGMEAPLIQQGFGQQFSANAQNAGAYNQALQNMLAQSFAAQQQNANLGLQGNEFNASLVNDAINRNTGYANQAIGQGAGYGNADYLNALAQQAGFMGTNLGSLGYILGQGMNNQLNSYLGGQQTGSQYANQIGQNQGYNQANPSSGVGGYPGAFTYYGSPAPSAPYTPTLPPTYGAAGNTPPPPTFAPIPGYPNPAPSKNPTPPQPPPGSGG